MKTHKLFIDGEQGTTGLALAGRLSARKDSELLVIPEQFRKDVSARRDYLNRADFAFLCLPDDAAREAVTLVENPDTVVIDASTAHRTEKGWAYGFPELNGEFRKNIENSKRIAVPGCHASGVLALIFPLREAGILPDDYPLSVYSITGYSGGGKKMIAQYECDPDPTLKSPRQYATGQEHKHLKEITSIARLVCPPVFSPIVAPYYSGMETGVPLIAELLTGKPGAEELYQFYKEYYRGSAVISVERAGGFIPADGMGGKDAMKIIIGGNPERIVPVALFDNLGKGASGAAVQCFNVAAGLTETEGLILL